MKKIIAIAAALCALTLISSCKKGETSGKFYYAVESNRSLVAEEFTDALKAVCNQTPDEVFFKEGEKTTCDAAVKDAFLNQAKWLDENPPILPVINGANVWLKVSQDPNKISEEGEILASYTFKE